MANAATGRVDEDRTSSGTDLYLHEGLDLEDANTYWSQVTGIPIEQLGKPYRAKATGCIRNSKHAYGCPRLNYSCAETHRKIMGFVHGLLDVIPLPGPLPEEFEPMHGV